MKDWSIFLLLCNIWTLTNYLSVFLTVVHVVIPKVIMIMHKEAGNIVTSDDQNHPEKVKNTKPIYCIVYNKQNKSKSGRKSPQRCIISFYLTLIWVVILGVCSNLARKHTSICSFRIYTFQYQGFLDFADVSIFFQKINICWPK